MVYSTSAVVLETSQESQHLKQVEAQNNMRQELHEFHDDVCK